jgi:uncharacterized protein (TIGR02246 family)
MRLSILMAGAMSAWLAACAPERSASGGDSGLLELKHSWQENFNRGDAAAVASLYSAEARLLMAGSPPVEGAANIQAAIDGMIKSGVKVRIGTDGHAATNDIAYVHGRYSVLSGGSAGHEVEKGDYVEVWRKTGGVWKIVLDMNVAEPSVSEGGGAATSL